MACGNASTTSDPVFSTTDLSVQSASYSTLDGSGAIAVAADGAIATGGSTSLSTGTQPPDVNVFSAGGSTPAQSYTEGATGVEGGISLAPGGLAWVDSTVLAAVMALSPGDPSATYQLRVITYPLLAQSALTLNQVGNSSLGSAISVTGVLTVNGAAAPGQTVTISRSFSGGPRSSWGRRRRTPAASSPSPTPRPHWARTPTPRASPATRPPPPPRTRRQ
jgi:hypothetical protein